MRTWRERTVALQAVDGVAHVLIFENRGAAVGTSNPHPHCQIYAGALVYGIAEREAEVAAAHFDATGRELLAEVVEREASGGRVLDANDHFFACVPWFARYAYEVLVLPRQPVTSLVDLDDDACRDLGTVLRDVVRRYDALWGIRMPYVLAVHQAPVGDHPHYPFHVELHPPLRAPGLLKYLAGPEIGGGSMTNESDPDEKAAELRDALRLTTPGRCSARSATTCATSWSAPAAWTWLQWPARPAPTRSSPSTRSPTTRSSTGSSSTGPASSSSPRVSTSQS